MPVAVPGAARSGRRALLPLPAAGAALLAALVYLNALDNPFVYDDFRMIVDNPSLLNVWDLRTLIVIDIARPLVTLSYAIDTAIWGPIPFGYHVTNLLLHVVNVVLVFWVARLASEDRARQPGQRLAGASSTAIGFVTATFFAVHPMMTQAVGYVSSRSEVLYAAGFLLAFLAGRRWLLGGGRRWWVACTGLWVAAVLAKETAVMFPVVLVAYGWFVLDAQLPGRRRRFAYLALPMLGVTLFVGILRIALLGLVEYPGGVRPDWPFALVAVDAFWRYLVMFYAPAGQSIFHALPDAQLVSVRAAAGLAGLAVLAWTVWALRRAHSLISAGLSWFALLLVPSSVLFVLGLGEAMAEHRAYLSAAGLFLTWGSAFGALWARPGRRRMIAAVAFGALVAQFSLLAVIRNAVWQDPIVLSQEAVDLAPQHWMPRILLAEAMRQNGRCPSAVREYREAIRIHPQDEFPYTRLAGCLVEARRLDEAAEALLRLRAINPDAPGVATGLGLFELIAGRPSAARAHFEEAVARAPGDAQAQLMLGFVEGRLPDEDRERLCGELRQVAGSSRTIEVCPPADPGGSGDAVDSGR